MASTAYDGMNGGAGGKFRNRTFRKSQTTPYDRPPAAIRPTQTIHNSNNNYGWLSKIVDPASKLITAGAHKLFASVFRKRLLPPPAPQPSQHPTDLGLNDVEDTEYVKQEALTNVVTSDTKVPDMLSDGIGAAELEDILKQKTFTRSQIDHLTTLLLSRTIENPDGVQKGRSELKLPDLHPVHDRRELSNLPAHGNRIELAQSAAISIPEVRPKMLPDDVALPAEIAKAYMGSRPTKVSVSCLQNLFSPISLAQKPVTDMGNYSNGLMTPRFQGRSAIHNMAHTPYSRVHPVTTFKAAETNFNTGGGSAYHTGTENNTSQKQVLKRRSSVLENDIGSVGPIRRIRQKPNLLQPKTLSRPPPGGRQVMHVSGVRSDVAGVQSSMEQSSQSHSISDVVSENSLLEISNGHVPSQSIEMAQKIFEELDKFSPKGNLRNNVDMSVEKLPTKTPGLEKLDSSKPLHSSQDLKECSGSLDSVHSRNHQFQTSLVEEVSAKKFMSTAGSLGTQDGAEGERAGSYVSSKSKIAEYMMPEPAVDRPQKRAFQMSANEDFLDLDDDLPSNEVALSTPSTEGKQHAEFVKESVPTRDTLQHDQTSAVEKPPVTTIAAQPEKSQLESLAIYSSAAETTSIVPSTVVSLSSSATNMIVLDTISALRSTPKSDEIDPEVEKIFTAPSSKSCNLPPFVCTLPPAAKDHQQETPISANRVTAEVNVPDKTDSKSTPGLSNTFIKSEDPPSVGGFSFGLLANNATPVNGVLGAVTAKSDASSPVLFTSSSNNQTSVPVSVSSPSSSTIFKFSNGSSQPIFIPSTFNHVTSSTSHVSGSVTAPSTFSSAFPSSSTTLAPFSSDTTDKSDAKLNSNALGNAASSLLNVKTSATGGDVETTGPTTSNKLTLVEAGNTPVSAFALSVSSQPASSVSVLTSTSTPIFSGQSASSVLTPTLTSTPVFPGQSISALSTLISASGPSFAGQSAALPSALVFGVSGSTGSSSGSVFRSFPANPFSSGSGTTSSGLGLNSSLLSSSLSTSSSTTSTMFGGFTSLSPKPTPSFAFCSSETATSSLAFGATANSSSTSNSASFVFGGNSALSASTPAMSNSPFQSQPAFGNASSQPFAFRSTSSTNNNDQSTMEDTMAEDSSQSPSTLAPSPFGASMAFAAQPSFGEPASAPSGGFGFNSTPAAGSPFHFNTQPTHISPQNSSFQASGSLEFNNGTNSFSLGTNDKSQRKFVRVKKTGRRK